MASFRVLRRILQGLKTPEPLLRRSSTSGSRLTTCLKAIRVLLLPGKGEGKTRVINTSEVVRSGGLCHGGTLSTTKLISAWDDTSTNICIQFLLQRTLEMQGTRHTSRFVHVSRKQGKDALFELQDTVLEGLTRLLPSYFLFSLVSYSLIISL